MTCTINGFGVQCIEEEKLNRYRFLIVHLIFSCVVKTTSNLCVKRGRLLVITHSSYFKNIMHNYWSVGPARPSDKSTTYLPTSYAKAERLKSKKDGRVLPMFRLEINDPTEAKALISQNLVCQVTGIVHEVEQFRSPISVTQCYNCQIFGHSVKTVGQNKKVSSALRTIHIKDARIDKQENLSMPIVRGHMLHHTKGVWNTKNGHSGNMWLTTKKHIPQLLVKTLSHGPKRPVRYSLSQQNS